MLSTSHAGRREATASWPAGPCNPRGCAGSTLCRRSWAISQLAASASKVSKRSPVPSNRPCLQRGALVPVAVFPSAWAIMRQARPVAPPCSPGALLARLPHRSRCTFPSDSTASALAVREARLEDAPQLADIDGECVAAGSGGWSLAIFEATMGRPSSTMLVAIGSAASAIHRASSAAAANGPADRAAAVFASVAAPGRPAAGPTTAVSTSKSSGSCISRRAQEQGPAPRGEMDDAQDSVGAAKQAAAEASSCALEAAKEAVAAAAAAAEERIAGFISGLFVGDELQVENLAVRAEHRGRGVGEALLRNLLGRHGICPHGVGDAPVSSSSSSSSSSSGVQPSGESGCQLLPRQQPDCLLEVKEGNVAAFALYRKLGFRVVGRRKNFYPDGAACLIMRLGGEG